MKNVVFILSAKNAGATWIIFWKNIELIGWAWEAPFKEIYSWWIRRGNEDIGRAKL